MRRLAPGKKKKSRKRFFILLILIGLVYYFFLRPQDLEDQVLSSKSSGKSANGGFVKVVKIASSLKEAIEFPLKGSHGSYSVVIKNLKTGESYLRDEKRTYEAGSLYKLWVMAEAFRQIESGDLKETDVLSQNIAVLNEKFGIATESAEQKEGSITLTVSEALNQMITISHNYGALLLTEKLKLSKVAAFLENYGFNASSVGSEGDVPITTAKDIALFFEKLNKGELANGANSKKMMDLLLNQKLNNKLPKNLPPGVQIAHKTGELGWISHDVGIIFSPKGEYIIVVLSESNNPKGAEERIAAISESVFNYFNK